MPWHTPKTRKRACERCGCLVYEHAVSTVAMSGAEQDALARGESLAHLIPQ